MNANEGPNKGHRKYMSAEGGPDQSMSQVYKNRRINSPLHEFGPFTDFLIPSFPYAPPRQRQTTAHTFPFLINSMF